MDPTIQLIQLTVKFEREAEAQRRRPVLRTDDFVDDKTVRKSGRKNRIQGNVLFCQQQCECA
ncbi:MAG TPA: hypothetical protein PLH19_08960 [Anaerolineae bacterium]|nr:hypothetical protein [Anaerolineae bacterium]HQH38645.1 hypothetical protein [Anaerolineae bacterium]